MLQGVHMVAVFVLQTDASRRVCVKLSDLPNWCDAVSSLTSATQVSCTSYISTNRTFLIEKKSKKEEFMNIYSKSRLWFNSQRVTLSQIFVYNYCMEPWVIDDKQNKHNKIYLFCYWTPVSLIGQKQTNQLIWKRKVALLCLSTSIS